MINKGRKKGTIRFSFHPHNGARKVQLAGTFTDWQPMTMRKQKSGDYATIVPLDNGHYEYKFMVDGQWQVDPDNPTYAENEHGTMNSVLNVD